MTDAPRSESAARPVARILFFLAVAAVSVLSLLPQRDLPKVGVSDKLEHAVAYFALAVFGGFAWRERRSLFALLALLVAMGGAIELLQVFSPGRSPDPIDAFANGAGAAAGVLAVLALRWRAWR